MSERSGILFLASVGGGWVVAWDMPMCVPDFCCPFEESVTAKDMLRTSRVPASSVCAKILVAVARRIMLKAHRAAKTCQRGPKGPGCSCSKMCGRQKPGLWGVCNESRSLVYMIVGTWCLPMSMVTCSRKCIDSIRPSVLVKLTCRLCRLVFSCSVHRFKCCVRGHD